jgi:very-short-patch-repair endonuclease
MKIHYDPRLKERARQLRKAGVLSEVLLWNQLKGRRLGFQFTRQKPIGSYIVDFYSNQLSLVIEIDGSSHNNRLESDCRKQAELEAMRLKVLRFLDSDVLNNLAGVVSALKEWIDERAKSTTP